MRTTKLRTLVATMLLASAPLALQAATSAATTTDIDKQTTQLNTTAENKGQTQVATKIASSFTKLAGSQDNALKLVQALRNGTSVTLTSTTSTGGTGTGTRTGTGTGTGGTTSTSFTPPTGKMGWGNVFISLALAQDQLARLGITDPTQAQLQAALMGGDVTGADGKTVTLKGIVQMRADGMGWGQIAQASGTKLGPVVSSIKSAHTKVAALPSASGSGTTAPTSASGTTAKSASKGVTTAAGTNENAGSKGLVTAGGTSAGGTVTHGNSTNAPGRGIVNAAGGGTANVTAATGSGNGQGVVNAGGGNAAGVSNAGGNGKGNAGGNGKGKGGG
jgi:hypothetical protein